MTTHQEILKSLFEKWSGEKMVALKALPQAGSDRIYYRIFSEEITAIGVFSSEIVESRAFVYFTQLFYGRGLHVPQLFAEDLEHGCYLLADLGDVSLFDHLQKHRKENDIAIETKNLYHKVIEYLIRFQIEKTDEIDFSKCYPTDTFNERSIKWDLNYFKYYFLRLNKIQFNESSLEDDFETLIQYLSKAENGYFMYRDFQSRNIMIHNDDAWFIDYQGGRRGPLQYDLASLLFQVRADLPFEFREELLEAYLQHLAKHQKVDGKQFKEYYYGFVLLRLLQVMGAYGFRGYYERRSHFLQSIPFAVKSLKWLIANHLFEPQMPELMKVLSLINELQIPLIKANNSNLLKIEINSFSFKKSIPIDYSGNGGGFVFDCRSLPNPGRYEEFKSLSGLDNEVILFLEKENAVAAFFNHVKLIVDISVKEYLQRGFTNLQINFGCTGGQHRSVFLAQKLASYLIESYKVDIAIMHTEQNNWLKK